MPSSSIANTNTHSSKPNSQASSTTTSVRQFPSLNFDTCSNSIIAKKVAALWKDESEEVKAIWKGKADKAKQQHLQQHPDYSYQPRKPSEKKRRMTKRKTATTTAAVVFADNNAQQVQTPQQPLPAFALNSLDLNLTSCNPIAMGANVVDAFDMYDEFIVHHSSGHHVIDFAANNNLSIELASGDAQPVNFVDFNISASELSQDVDAMMDAASAPVIATGAGAMAPAGPFWKDHDSFGPMMTAEQIQNQDFLNSADAKDLEQDRQELLFGQTQEWNVWQDNPAYLL